MMQKNVGSVDRAIRVVVGLVLIWWSVNLDGLLSGASLIVGTILLVTGIVGRCLIYKLLKMKGTNNNKCENCGEDNCLCNKCENCGNKVCVCKNEEVSKTVQ